MNDEKNDSEKEEGDFLDYVEKIEDRKEHKKKNIRIILVWRFFYQIED